MDGSLVRRLSTFGVMGAVLGTREALAIVDSIIFNPGELPPGSATSPEAQVGPGRRRRRRPIAIDAGDIDAGETWGT